jgi:AcrR family transcriptional regulator
MDDTRMQILNAAGPIFAQRGFRAATVREICKEADVNVASVNYYFGDKDGLYLESVQLASQLQVARFPLPERLPESPAEVRLYDFILTLLTRLLDNDQPWQTRLMMREVLQPTSACRELVEGHMRPHFEILLQVLSELVPADTRPSQLRRIGFSVVGQCLHYRVAQGVIAMLTPEDERAECFSTEQLAEHIWQFTVSALHGGGLTDWKRPSLACHNGESRLNQPSTTG